MKKNELSNIKYGEEIPVKSGFVELDKIISGWENGNLIVIASCPRMGKTAFALSMIKNIAIDNHIPAAIFSLEKPTDQFVSRLMQNISGVENVDSPNEEELNLLNEAENQLDNAPFFIDDTPSLSVTELCKRAHRLVHEHRVKVIMIDYLDLMSGGEIACRSREEEISMITRALKELAKELNTPIIVFWQLSKLFFRDRIENLDRYEAMRPQLKDLKPGTIEQDADVICLIYRPEFYKIYKDMEGNDQHGMAQIIVAKSRNGKTGDALLKFSDHIARFENIDE